MQIVWLVVVGYLDVPEQKKGNLKLLLKYFWRELNSKYVEVSGDGGSSWYAKLHNHLKVSFSRKIIRLLVSNKNLNSLKATCLGVTSFLRILFGETRQLCWCFLLKFRYHKRHSSIFRKYDNAFVFSNGSLLYGAMIEWLGSQSRGSKFKTNEWF